MRNHDDNQQYGSQQGTGSSENTDREREAQRNEKTDLNKQEKKDIAREAGIGRKRVADIEDLGGLSGRDDYAGGDNDGVSESNTNERTDR